MKKKRLGRQPDKEINVSKSGALPPEETDANFAAFLRQVAEITPVTASETGVEMTRRLRALSRGDGP